MKIGEITVIGAGTMGRGIAQVAAQSGYRVCLYDVDASLIEVALRAISDSMARAVDRGRLTAESRDEACARLRGETALDVAASSAWLVIEAIPELLSLKQELFRTMGRLCPPHSVFASNTSSLSIADLASASGREDRFIGMHFFNPVPAMKLLEIVVTSETSAATLTTCRSIGETLGKECIVVRDTPGFATSRLGVCLGMEAIRMLEQGVARAEDIDKAMTLGYAHPMGPLRLTDLIGLDVRLNITDYLHTKLGSEVFKAPQLLRRMVSEGKLGKKSGQGFYRWDQ